MEWGCFPAWDQWDVVHGFLCRTGGCSPVPRGLNLSYNVGDDREHVLANRQKMAETLGFPLERRQWPASRSTGPCGGGDG